MPILTEVFGDYPRVRILEAFAENCDEMLFIADIARITNLSKMTVNTHINKLLKEDIIRKTKKAGIIQYYQLNEDNPKVNAILNIVRTIGSLNIVGKTISSGHPSTLDGTQTPYTYSTQTTTSVNNSEIGEKTEEKM